MRGTGRTLTGGCSEACCLLQPCSNQRETSACLQGEAGAEAELAPEMELPSCSHPALDHCSFLRDCGDRLCPQKEDSGKRGTILHALSSQATAKTLRGAGRPWCCSGGKWPGLIGQGLTPVSCPVNPKPEGMPCSTSKACILILLPKAKVLHDPIPPRIWTATTSAVFLSQGTAGWMHGPHRRLSLHTG